jgi:hypothetical protein
MNKMRYVQHRTAPAQPSPDDMIAVLAIMQTRPLAAPLRIQTIQQNRKKGGISTWNWKKEK